MTLSADELKELRVKAERSMFVVSLPTRTALSLIQSAELNAELVAERRNIVSHATMGATDGEGMSVNAICVEITRLRNELYKAKGSAGHE